ncbi:mannose receptor, C type [Mytilus galloprovincialis]|uniref:Mannose receptor, C type n=1 Tax=Mytilus galloprovincialis TaxID=29158 RepID=A0A8B6GRF0_MYTGA|nr:mannose receptor, C type [Mytilus galloprovincialis]
MNIKKSYITTPEAISNPCPSGYLSYGMDCFQYVPTKATWSAADADCKSRKSFLATLANPFEQKYLFLMINDPKNSGSYSWTQAGWSVGIYTNWDNGKPTRPSGGGCVAANISGQCADTPCSQALPYVCKSTTGTPPATPPGPNGQYPGPGWISYGPK